MKVQVNTNIPIKVFVLIEIFSIVIGILLLYAAIGDFLKVNIIKSNKVVEATVLDSNMVVVGAQEGRREVAYLYEVEGKEYSDRDFVWWKISNINLRAGDKIDIMYNIEKPEETKIYHISYLLGIVSLILIISSPISVKERLKYN